MNLSLKRLMEYEKNTNRMKCPELMEFSNFQDPFYSPEEGNIFDIKSYWLKKSDLHYFFTKTNVENIFMTEDKILFLIHPESEDLYKNIDKSNLGPVFKGLATSSSRTVLLFLNDKPICFAKLSLNKNLTGKIRNISLSQTIRTIGTTIILDDLNNKNKLPKNFKYFREVISVIPQHLERGGMIIREIHEDLLKDEFHLLPMYSIFTKQKNGNIPLFDLSKNIDIEKFIYSKIIIPFVDQFFVLGLLGVFPEPHSQNLLINFYDKDFSFYHRDFGGFTIDLKLIDCEIPFLKNKYREYSQHKHEVLIIFSLFIYFESGVLYGLSHVSEISYEKLKKKYRNYLKRKLLNNGIRSTDENFKEKIIYFFKRKKCDENINKQIKKFLNDEIIKNKK